MLTVLSLTVRQSQCSVLQSDSHNAQSCSHTVRFFPGHSAFKVVKKNYICNYFRVLLKGFFLPVAQYTGHKCKLLCCQSVNNLESVPWHSGWRFTPVYGLGRQLV